MSRLRRILVGHNFFPDGEVAVSSAAVLAARADVMLYLLHAIELVPTYRYLPWPSPQFQTLHDELVERLQNELKTLTTKPELSSLQVTTEIRPGKPFVELLATARRR